MFTEHALKLVEVANLACSMSNNDDGVKMVRYAASQIENLCPQVQIIFKADSVEETCIKYFEPTLKLKYCRTQGNKNIQLSSRSSHERETKYILNTFLISFFMWFSRFQILLRLVIFNGINELFLELNKNVTTDCNLI